VRNCATERETLFFPDSGPSGPSSAARIDGMLSSPREPGGSDRWSSGGPAEEMIKPRQLHGDPESDLGRQPPFADRFKKSTELIPITDPF
jgi:hypothetical protein